MSLVSKPKLVGLTGRAGAGKDTVADYLVKQYGYKKIAFAEHIKQGLNAMFGWSMSDWEDRGWKESVNFDLGFSPRKAAQTLGTEWGRGLNQDLWLLVAMNRIRRSDRVVVISDVRFENEASLIREMGGVVIHIGRVTDAVEDHSSEAGVVVAPGDLVIDNYSNSLDDLYDAVGLVWSGNT